MAASKVDKEAFALISQYISLYRARYSSAPIINKYKEKWGMASLVEDFGKEEVSDTLTYYFKINREGHSLPWFYNNFSTIHISRLSAEKDDKIRAAAWQKTQELRAEYLNGIH